MAATHPTSGRKRFGGTADALALVLTPSLKTPGSIKYSADLKGKVNVPTLKEYKDLLLSLHKLQPNMSFTQKSMQDAVNVVLKSKNKTWKLSKSECKSFAAVVSNRIRAMCRHLHVAMHKKKAPDWVSELGFDMDSGMQASIAGDDEGTGADQEGHEEGGEEEEKECDEVVDEEALKVGDEMHVIPAPKAKAPAKAATKAPCNALATTAATEYLFGWDTELNRAWRQTGSGKKTFREFTTDLHVKENEKFVFARWSDGLEKEITQLPVDLYQMTNQGNLDAAAKGRRGPLWTSTHIASGLAVTITTRNDRQLLMSIFWGPAQVCQLPVNRFESQDVCLKLLTDIAVDFCSGALTKDQLYSKRDELAKDRHAVNLKARVKVDATKDSEKGCQKRPAATTEVAATSELAAGTAPAQPAPKKPKAKAAAASSASTGVKPLARASRTTWMDDVPESPFDHPMFRG